MKVYLKKISFQEFEKDFYKKLTKMFPTNEQRDLDDIYKSYESGNEEIYKIILEDKTAIGFFMLEKLPDCPYYLDYFTIYKGYQDKGFGSAVLKAILDELCGDDGLCAEIEKVDIKNEKTVKRWAFYKKLGFKLINSEIELFYELYNPIIYCKKEYSRKEVNKILFKYYNLNCEEEAVAKYCKVYDEGDE